MPAHRLVFLPLMLLVACAAELPAGPLLPRAGQWVGDDVAFTVQDGQIVDLVLQPQACVGDGGCKATVGGPVAGSRAVTAPFSLDAAPLHVEGRFTSAVQASGTFAATGDCCSAAGVWVATWVPGSDPGADASATGGDSGSAQPGSADWQGASTGTLHPGPARPASPPTSPPTASAAQQQAAVALEALRAQVGVEPVVEDAAIDKAAQAHADFYAVHAKQYKAKGLSPHAEDPAFGPGFSGQDFGDRMQAAGFSGSPSSEIMAFLASPQGAVQGWLDTVYHRLPLIDPRSVAMGYGLAKQGGQACDVMNFAARAGAKDDPIVVYPWPGQTGVPASWNGLEGPQPPKPPGGYPSGPVVTARFPYPVTVQAHELRDAAGDAVPHVWLEPANDPNLAQYDPNTRVIYAHEPLAAGVYTVRLDVTRNGQPERLQWRFTVGP